MSPISVDHVSIFRVDYLSLDNLLGGFFLEKTHSPPLSRYQLSVPHHLGGVLCDISPIHIGVSSRSSLGHHIVKTSQVRHASSPALGVILSPLLC